MYKALEVWRERLANYIRECGPVHVVYNSPLAIEGKHGTRYCWQARRGMISLAADGEPDYDEEKKGGPVRRYFVQADYDTRKIAAKEGRIIFHWTPGKLTAEACEEVLALLSDLTGRDELWR